MSWEEGRKEREVDENDDDGGAVLWSVLILWQYTLFRNPWRTPLFFFTVFFSLESSFDMKRASPVPTPIPIPTPMEFECICDCGCDDCDCYFNCDFKCSSLSQRNEKWSTGSSSDVLFIRVLGRDPRIPVPLPEMLRVPVNAPPKTNSVRHSKAVQFSVVQSRAEQSRAEQSSEHGMKHGDKKIVIAGYWATSISTVRTTVL